MSTKPQGVLVLGFSRDEDGTFTILDSLNRSHQAETPAGIGKIVARLLADAELPRSKVNHDKDVSLVAEIAKRVTGRVAPDLTNVVEAFEPAAHAVAGIARRTRSRRSSNRRGGVTRS
jgi:hypothetical protein